MSDRSLENSPGSNEQPCERAQNEVQQLRDQLTHTRGQLAYISGKLQASQGESEEFRAILREQLQAAKKLSWFLAETEKTAARLRSSRRWKMGNPFAAIRAAFGGQKLSGYGHLEKIVSEYARWKACHPQIERVEEQLLAFDQATSEGVISLLKRDGRAAATPISLPVPEGPIHFSISEKIEVSIVIPVFNQLAYTQACLASVQQHQDSQAIEVMVVDDCSSDGTRESLSQIAGLIYLRNENNLGFVASCNHGAAQARGEYLLFLNNDTLVTSDWLSALLETFRFEPEAGLVGCKLIYPDGRLQEAGGIVWRDASGWNRGRKGDRDEPAFNYLREVDYCSGACLMLPKALFEQVGGFDVRYAPAYYEDTDLAFKVRAAGYKVLYQPLSEVIHFEGATSGTDLSTGAKRYQEINRTKFQEKWSDVLATKPPNGDICALERLDPGRQRILVIDHHLPMPDRDSGSVRMFGILTILHQLGHRVTFIPSNLAANQHYADELRKRGIEVLVRPHIKNIGQYLQSYGALLDSVILSRWGTGEKHMPEIRFHAPQSRLIFDTVDLHFVRVAREAGLARTAESIRQAGETRTRELDLIRSVDETWVVSEAERQLLLAALENQKIEVISNIVEVVRPETPFSKRANILFIGSFLHPPNIDAVLFFANEIQPLITERLPGIKFYIIGNKAPPEIAALEDEATIITGPVSDVRSYFESVKLSVAPIRYGAGVKGKVNQSMGLGVPVVATSVAIEGMSLTHGQDVLVADDPAQFAERVIELYNSEETWARLSQHGLETTTMRYSHDSARQTLSRLFSADRTAPARRPSSSSLR